METNNTNFQLDVNHEQDERKPFILGNTKAIGLTELQEDYLVPVFSRDNIETISHSDFINVVADAAQTFFQGEQFTEPQIRVSHEMIVRTRKGNGKLVENLEKDDSGSYYQRMMFMIELPGITYTVNGNRLNLQIVGVRSYSETNLLGNSTQKQMFRIGIGFLNRICTNMLLRTDGVKFDVKVTNAADLYRYCIEVFSGYNYKQHIEEMKLLQNTIIDVNSFAQFLGKARMYQALPTHIKNELGLPEFILPEAQINQAVRDYYSDENFSGYGKQLTAWNFYQLLTNYKNNYIDTTMERCVNAYEVAKGLAASIEHQDNSWGWFIE